MNWHFAKHKRREEFCVISAIQEEFIFEDSEPDISPELLESPERNQENNSVDVPILPEQPEQDCPQTTVFELKPFFGSYGLKVTKNRHFGDFG